MSCVADSNDVLAAADGALSCAVVVNARSGGTTGRDLEAFEAALSEVLEESGHRVIGVFGRDEPIAEAIDRALEDEPAFLVVAGGDGTIRLAAERVAGRSTVLGIVPLGTVNALARELGLDGDPIAVAHAISKGRVAALPVGRIGGELFVKFAVCGVLPGIAQLRERARKSFDPLLWLHALGGMARRLLAASPRRYRLAFGAEARPVSTCALAVRIDAPPGGPARLRVMAHRPGKPLGVLGFLARAHSGIGELEDEVVGETEAEFALDAHRTRMRVAVDGEVVRVDLPVRVTLEADALKVLLPMPDHR